MKEAITSEQLSLMKHTIGLDNKSKTRKGIYKAYRNYFCQGENPDADFEDLCKKGLCETWTNISGSIYYDVLEKGAKLIKEFTGITVILED